VVVRDGEAMTLSADRVVLAAGTYGSPAILLRSGIGDPEELVGLGVEVRIGLPAVGRNLVNHWTTRVAVDPGAALAAAIAEEAAADGVHAAGTVAKASSSLCDDGSWDTHVFTICWRLADGSHLVRLNAAALRPHSRGSLTLASLDPEAAPRIAHNALTDAAGHDARVLADGLRSALAILATPSIQATGARVAAPLDTAPAALAAYVAESLGCYYHPVGTCAIGSVVDGLGAVYGADDLFVADASVMPEIPRANTHLSVLALAERLAEELAG
jgi:choline dehydrogenase